MFYCALEHIIQFFIQLKELFQIRKSIYGYHFIKSPPQAKGSKMYKSTVTQRTARTMRARYVRGTLTVGTRCAHGARNGLK